MDCVEWHGSSPTKPLSLLELVFGQSNPTGFTPQLRSQNNLAVFRLEPFLLLVDLVKL